MHLTRRTVIAGLALAGYAASAAAQSELTLRTPDEVPVGALSYGSGNRGVILVPGGHGIGETWHLQAERLAQAGFRVLAIDYRGLGRPLGAVQDGDKAHLDVLAAMNFLRAGGIDRVSLVGASWGGRAAAMAAIAEPRFVERIVLLAPSGFDEPERLAGRKLFIVAAEDRDGAGRARLDSVRLLHDRTPEPKSLVVLDGAAHAQFLFLTEQGERLYAEIERFLRDP